ncbi:polyribonucleotide nucleotidyltransferase [Patescibacteria group bacterium]|nr:polyribonucleotide nucleotidyltransferase [Candidatus Falkowbacteria bacterium]MBU3905604.1 polyribonucleotide nucleotidyltransferase [Patescibacteria group bacterium]MBU4015502.1 polyribonucleotide nucleotidyltransferase [Patescibacteria group bacterium]MBU4026553.1 polyribonucleotide nucleotidyltransferase [Patescibacteria group bacterium]MBU4073075.1 polyribonucleotide nucleotidyltransferase [Patescibacteria group bacterium]
MNNEQVFTMEWLGRTLTIKTGKVAKQANAAVTVQYGDTVVLGTVVESKEERETDYFPLMVDFEERLYAAGIIKGSRWIKREGRPTDDAILSGRMIDRSIRPLFSNGSRKEVQVILTILSADGKNDHDIVALVAASAALAISGVDWAGPIGSVRVGRINNELVFNPTYEEREQSDFDIIVAGTAEKTIMIEAGAKEVKEDDVFKAIVAGQKELQGPIKLIKQMQNSLSSISPSLIRRGAGGEVKLISQDEIDAEEEKEKIFKIAAKWLDENINKTLFDKAYYTKGERKAAVAAIKDGLDQYLFEQEIGKSHRAQAIKSLVESTIDTKVTKAILENKQRVDGRKLDEIRQLSAEASVLPRNHGSGLFSRGETQVMSIITLGPPGVEQSLEGIEGTGTKRFMHHYNFPPFSVGEAKFMRGPGRRDIGHGALAEKALQPVVPAKEEFPYTIRVVSETLGSNGSSSMASVCGASLALMDAGAPIKKAVAGIAMGLASNDDMSQWEVLTDIQDLEDGKGGMDLKIAGTKDGITAMQMDTKTNGLTDEIIKKALTQGLKARLEILEVMDKAISEPRPDLSPYAPRITSFSIDTERIREVIGPGGKIINEIIAATGVSIDIDDDGLVCVCGTEAEKCEEAVMWIKNIVREFKAGEVFTGKVVRILDFGAFVELTPGHDGMAHVSELAPYRIEKPSDFLNEGDIVTVKIKEIDEKGRVNLTMKGLLENEKLWKDEKGKSNGFASPRFNNNSDRGRFNNGGNRGGNDRFRR